MASRILKLVAILCTSLGIVATGSAVPSQTTVQATFERGNRTISAELFADLEELSRLVGISYCVGYQGISKPFECLSHCADFENFELVQTWDSGILDSASCGYITLSHGSRPPRIILAFRGSNSLSDAVSDLMTMPAEYTPYEPPNNNRSSSHSLVKNNVDAVCADCKVHAGFLRAWHTTRDSILPIIQDTISKYPDYELILVGHSLGGAIAGLAALEFAAMGWYPTITTFGEPRFGNQELAEYTDKVFPKKSPWRGEEGMKSIDSIGRYRRVTHLNDPIPLYPLEDWGWRMHGAEVYISTTELPPTKEGIVLCDGPQDPACIAGARTRQKSPLQKQGIDLPGLPVEWKLWEILFAHREYFWRLGLCWDPQGSRYPKKSKDSNEVDKI